MKKIAFISQPEFFRFTYENDLNNKFQVKEFPFTYFMTPEEFNQLVEYKADYNIFFRGEYIPDEVLKHLSGKKIALSSEPFPRLIEGRWEFTRDSLKRYLSFRNIRTKNYDYVFHYDSSSLSLFKSDRMDLSGEFVFPVSTQTYKPNKEEKKWDFFFIGRSTTHREEYFSYLKHHYNFLHIAHGIWGPELVKYINKSKICLNIHAENEVSWEPRVQMLLSSGAFLLSEKITPNKFIKPGRDFIEVQNPEDLIKKAEYYLKNSKERNKIVEKSLLTIKNNFDSEKRFTTLINEIEGGQIKGFNPSEKGKLLFNILEKVKFL